MAKRRPKNDRLVLSTLAQIKALAEPLRYRVFELLTVEPRTAKQAAGLMGMKPTRLYHHFGVLEKAGLIRKVKTRKKRGTTEKYYEAVAQEVEIDPDTGEVEVANFVAADDVGRVINPMIVEGQIHGGVAQGIGQALLEHCEYEASGQLVTGSYMDYCMPRADNISTSIDVQTVTTHCTHNELGVKGCGEVGAIGSPPAIINAIVDALSSLGVTDMQMPATPKRVWEAINDAKSQVA
jgi:CO/xanthine dehydrogenase Mo-binding subunit